MRLMFLDDLIKDIRTDIEVATRSLARPAYDKASRQLSKLCQTKSRVEEGMTIPVDVS